MNILLIFILYHLPMYCWSSRPTNTTTETKPNDQAMSYRGYQLWKVTTDTKDKLNLIKNLRSAYEVTSWGNHIKPDLLIRRDKVEEVRKKFQANDVQYKVLMPDVQRAIDKQNPVKIEDMKLSQSKPKFSFDAYHTLSTIYDHLRELDHTYPYIKIESIGFSVDHREIPIAIISNGNKHNKAIFLEGGMHAREWISPASLMFVIEYLARNITSNDEKNFIKDFDWYILPIANPDGYHFTHATDRLWRKNRSKHGDCYGTDLNRNFGYEWTAGIADPCELTYPGPSAFSEPETMAIRNFIKSFPKAYWKVHVSVHSYGQLILIPYGYRKILPDDYDELIRVAGVAAQKMFYDHLEEYEFGPISDIYIATGVSTDWAKGSIGIKYPYTLELADRGDFAFLLPANMIVSAATQFWEIVRVIAEAAAANN